MGQCWFIVAYLQLRDPNVLVGLMARMAPPRGALWAARAPSKAVWETQAETDERRRRGGVFQDKIHRLSG